MADIPGVVTVDRDGEHCVMGTALQTCIQSATCQQRAHLRAGVCCSSEAQSQSLDIFGKAEVLPIAVVS